MKSLLLLLLSFISTFALPINQARVELAIRSINQNDQPSVSDVNNWEVKLGKLSLPRSRISTTSVGDLGFFAGGYLSDRSEYISLVDIYHYMGKGNEGEWSTAELSVARSGISAGNLAGRYAVFVGGLDTQSFKAMDIIDVYDTETDSWSTLHLKVPRSSPALINLGDRLAVVGGLSGNNNYISKAVEFLDADLNLTEGADLNPDTFPQFGVATSDPHSGMGLLTAGYQNENPGDRFPDFQSSNQTTVFFSSDESKDNQSGANVHYKMGPSFPYPRWGASGSQVNDVSVIGGGYFSESEGPVDSARVDFFCFNEDPSSEEPGTWCGTTDLSEARSYINAVRIGHYSVFLGGSGSSRKIDVVDPAKQSLVDHSNKLQLLFGWNSASATVIDRCLAAVAGGSIVTGEGENMSNSDSDIVQFVNACSS